MEDLKELVKERKKICSSRFFSKIIGYTEGWISRAERGEVSYSKRFVSDYAEALQKVKNILK